ncbi:MAG TPA: lysylphosphatidylglycerol synthase transmembrane domain-containing protein [Anaeromyxobacteraceae bacterium]
MTRGRVAQALSGILVSAAALWLTLRGKDLAAIWRAALETDPRHLVAYLGVLLLIHLLRTVRWGLLLQPVAPVPFARLNAVSAVGFMALMVLPFRIGEFARPWLVADRPRLRVSAALSTVVVERVVDGLFTALLLVISLLAVAEGTPGLRLARTAGWVVLGVFAAVLGFLLLAHRNRAAAVRFVHRVADPLSPRLAERAAGVADAFLHGLRRLPGAGRMALFLALTALYWGANGMGMLLLARGLGIGLGAAQAFAVLGVLVVGVMIPAGPGMVGTFQAGVVLGLSLFLPAAVVDVRGQAFANVLWAAQLAQTTALGVAFLFSSHIRLQDLFRAPARVEEELEEEEAELRRLG